MCVLFCRLAEDLAFEVPKRFVFFFRFELLRFGGRVKDMPPLPLVGLAREAEEDKLADLSWWMAYCFPLEKEGILNTLYKCQPKLQ